MGAQILFRVSEGKGFVLFSVNIVLFGVFVEDESLVGEVVSSLAGLRWAIRVCRSPLTCQLF